MNKGLISCRVDCKKENKNIKIYKGQKIVWIHDRQRPERASLIERKKKGILPSGTNFNSCHKEGRIVPQIFLETYADI